MSPGPRSNGSFEPDPDEYDTGRVYSAAGSGRYPPASELLATRSRFGSDQDSWPSYFDAELSVSPSPIRPNRKSLAAVGLVAATAVGGVIVWALQSSPEPASRPDPDRSTSAATVISRDAEAEVELRRLLPSGYPVDVCEFVAPPKNARAQSDCDANVDPRGPRTATYTLFEDKAVLDEAFSAAIQQSTRVNCPGSIQSPGPWRRNITPQEISGALYCGIHDGRPTVVWSDEARLLVSVVRADAHGPTLGELYAWWSSHS